MRRRELRAENAKANAAVEEFRAGRQEGEVGRINARFHKYKNRLPFFGVIEAGSENTRFVMFSGNDDLVAMTYFWHGIASYESKSMALWEDAARRAKVVFDIGAFTGVYSLMAATANPSAAVYALEPVRRSHARLILNVRANRLSRRVKTFNLGVAERDREASINQVRTEEILGNGASILDRGIPIIDSSERVRLVALDGLIEREGVAPDLLKLDVEGAEVMALEGMTNLLHQTRPTMLIEVTQETAPVVVERLTGLGYSAQVIDEETGRLYPLEGTVSKVANLWLEPR